ncbi:ABC transporter substrate-binding protein [Streptomyces sp. WMMC1477]|uniref:ABC transporter substrate-binding protein n=1 Tax=Streptomyces sp. WMMC1477 TaxID=3015155 RepID=UPI0022B699D2|nr:ABC transporter substrate-binding protein [Streptomyces sp. WMMC1477]MCZ7433597.1 ABC transporter substrate-binding protein [Streptomyces sp. WMMC1477]
MTARFTRRPSARRRLAAAGAIAVTGALLLTGCGDQTDDADGGSGDGGKEGAKGTKSSEAPLFSELPKEIQDAGVIRVGSDIAYPPIEFFDDKELKGVDPGIAEALSEQLGVKLEFKDAGFDQLIIGLNKSGKYDIVMSAMTDTKERQDGAAEDEAGGVDFVDYFKAGSALLVEKGNPKKIESLDDLCGLGVAAQRGTANETLVNEQNKKCGDDKIDFFIADKDTDSVTQLQNGRVQVVVTDYPVAIYSAETAGGGDRFEVVGDQIDAAPYGIAVHKDNTQLRDAIQKALQAIMDNGEYAKVLKEWGAEAGALEQATVNAGK